MHAQLLLITIFMLHGYNHRVAHPTYYSVCGSWWSSDWTVPRPKMSSGQTMESPTVLTGILNPLLYFLLMTRELSNLLTSDFYFTFILRFVCIYLQCSPMISHKNEGIWIYNKLKALTHIQPFVVMVTI